MLLLDTDGEGKRRRIMGVLVDWPGQDAHPRRLVFLARADRAARLRWPPAGGRHRSEREELNALYVALTRARQTLVISSPQPHADSAVSGTGAERSRRCWRVWQLARSRRRLAGQNPLQRQTGLPAALCNKSAAGPRGLLASCCHKSVA